MRVDTILVVVDPVAGPDQPVLKRAVWLAKRSGARLELFACDYDPHVDATMRIAESDRVERQERLVAHHHGSLEDLAKPLRADGITVTIDVVWDHPLHEAILKKDAGHDYWLVAKETQHLNALQRTLLTNTDWHLIRKCAAPLLLVKNRPVAEEPNVLAAVDPVNEYDKPAALDDRIFTFAADLARTVRGHLHVFHAYAAPMGIELPPDVREIIAREHRAAVNEFLNTHPVLGERAYLYEGLPHECLPRAAEEHGADFVVMGAVARSGLKRLFIGSTAERVLDRVPCDLIIIKPLDFEVSADAD